ncbi:hypothetical protein CG017_03252 [Burkholderia glumae]|nr:hypothetical protein CG017_03252 [Burkholderia glumae]
MSAAAAPGCADATTGGTRLVTAESPQPNTGPYSSGRRSTQARAEASSSAASPSALLRP